VLDGTYPRGDRIARRPIALCSRAVWVESGGLDGGASLIEEGTQKKAMAVGDVI
jgi:hypothetical protein